MESYGIGARFRNERLGQSLSLDDIATRTRIPARFLAAIEADDLSQFPGIVFARNFVRQYAVALGLDPEPLLDRLPRLDQSSVRLPDPPAKPRSRRTRLSNPAWSSVGWALLAVAAASGAWIYYSEIYHSDSWRIADWRTIPGFMHRAAPRQVGASVPAPVNSVEAASMPASAPETAPPAIPQSGPPETAIAAASVEAAAIHLADAAASPVQVVVTAHEPSWVSVTADSKSAFVGTLKPNETREISALDHVKILTGNAGGLTISLNGKTLGPIGPSGQVRSVRLTAEGSELLLKAPAQTANAPADPL